MAAQLKTHSDLHVQRKVFHFTSIFIIFWCTVLFSTKTNWLIYLVVGVPGLLFDLFRQQSGKANRVALKMAAGIIRKTELKKLTGASFAILGIGLIYFLFPKNVAQLSTLFLAVGDPIASFFGILFGKNILFGKKSLEGFLAGSLFCTATAYAFFSFHLKISDSLIPLSLISGFIGGLSELIPLWDLDDNLTQPLISSGLLVLLFTFWGGLL